MLNSDCMEAVCYNNSVNGTKFTPEDSSAGSCMPQLQQFNLTMPDVGDHPHWFFLLCLVDWRSHSYTYEFIYGCIILFFKLSSPLVSSKIYLPNSLLLY